MPDNHNALEVVLTSDRYPSVTVNRGGASAIAPQAPTRPTEAPVENPARPADRPEPDSGSDPDADLDDELERIIREIPDPTPQPGGE